jgi:hypothetical protein
LTSVAGVGNLLGYMIIKNHMETVAVTNWGPIALASPVLSFACIVGGALLLLCPSKLKTAGQAQVMEKRHLKFILDRKVTASAKQQQWVSPDKQKGLSQKQENQKSSSSQLPLLSSELPLTTPPAGQQGPPQK